MQDTVVQDPISPSTLLSLPTCARVHVIVTLTSIDASSASYIPSIRYVLSSPGIGPETNFARNLNADTTTTAGLLIFVKIVIAAILSCRVSESRHETFGTRL
jgi:hypothetical protein